MGYALSIAGCPYVFTTADVATLPTVSGTADTADWYTGWTLARGYLLTPEVEWTERMAPFDADLEAGGLTFRLHDRVATSGLASGYPLISYLAARDPATIPQSPLSSSIPTVTLGATVDFPSRINSLIPGPVWVGAEAFYATAISLVTGVLTITDRGYPSGVGGMGYLGTHEQVHAIEPDASVKPVLYSGFPGLDRRRAILWRVSESGVATPLWRGYVGRGPRLVARGEGAGAVWELPCEHAWTRHKSTSLGVPGVQATPRGVSSMGAYVGSMWTGVAPPRIGRAGDTTAPTYFETCMEALRSSAQRLNAYYAGGGVTPSNLSVQVRERGQGAEVTLLSPTTASGMLVHLRAGSRTASSTEPVNTAIARATAFLDVLPSVVIVAPLGVAIPIPVDCTSWDDLPGTWASGSSYDDGGFRTDIRAVLRGDVDDNTALEIYPTSHDAANRRLTGTFKYLPRRPLRDDVEARFRFGSNLNGGWHSSYGFITIDSPVQCKLAVKIRAQHWVFAFKRGLSDTTYTKSGLDDRDWSWDLTGRITRATDGLWASRDYVWTGETTLGDEIKSAAIQHGVGVGVRASRLCFVPWEFAIKTGASAVTIPSTALLRLPTYERLSDALVTSAQVESPGLRINDARAISKYGQGRTVEISLRNYQAEAQASRDRRALLTYLLSRCVGLWNEPTAAVTITLPLSYFDGTIASVQIGDRLMLTEWMIPNAAGDRGLSAASLFVFGVTPSTKDGSVTVECVVQPTVYGYSPCCRAESVTSSTVIRFALDYVHGETDYAGSDQSGYAGTASDAGVSRFVAGDRVEFIQRDSTTHTTESRIVDSVNAAAREITFTVAISAGMQTAIAAGFVDLRYDDRDTAGLQSGQQDYAWIGSSETGVVGTSTQELQPWAP